MVFSKSAALHPTGLALALLVATAASISMPVRAAEVESAEVLIDAGTLIPDNSARLDTFLNPVTHSDGAVAFVAVLRGLFSSDVIDPSRDTGVYRISRYGELIELAREGDPMPDGDGFFGDFTAERLAINAAGQVVFRTIVAADDAAILVSDGSGPPVVVGRTSEQISMGTGRVRGIPGRFALNDQGQVLFDCGLTSFGGDRICRGDGSPGSLELITSWGVLLPVAGFLRDILSAPLINDAGLVLLKLDESNPRSSGLYLKEGFLDPFEKIVRCGDLLPSPTATEVFGEACNESFLVGAPVLNDRGETAFFASLSGPPGGETGIVALFVGDAATLTELVRVGDPAPDGAGPFSRLGPEIDLDDAGRVLFSAALIGASGAKDVGVFLADHSGARKIALRGEPAPGGGYFSNLFSPLGITGGSFAGVVFEATVEVLEPGGNLALERGLFYHDGRSVRSIVRIGDVVRRRGKDAYGNDRFARVDTFEVLGPGSSGPQGEGTRSLGVDGRMAVSTTRFDDTEFFLWSVPEAFNDGFESGDTSFWSFP